MKNLYPLLAALCFGLTAKAQQQKDTAYTIIPAPQNTWGYNITINKKIFIHQTTIPGVDGNNGFATKQDAAKIAKLVLQKMHKGIMPPAISTKELEEQKVIHLKKQ